MLHLTGIRKLYARLMNNNKIKIFIEESEIAVRKLFSTKSIFMMGWQNIKIETKNQLAPFQLEIKAILNKQIKGIT